MKKWRARQERGWVDLPQRANHGWYKQRATARAKQLPQGRGNIPGSIPGALSGTGSIPAALSGIGNIPSALSGTGSIPAALSGNGSIPAALSMDAFKKNR